MSARVWALLGDRTGDNNQVLALCEALGVPFEAKRLRYGRRRGRLSMRAVGPSLFALTEEARDPLVPPWPELVVAIGRRSVPVARWIRRRSGGRCRLVHLGNPRRHPGLFDLVLTTPQYPVRRAPNVHELPLALSRHGAAPAPGGAGNDRLRDFPSPRRLLLVGGPTRFWRLDAGVVTAAAELAERAEGRGGSLLVLTSRRTPTGLREALARVVEAAGPRAALAEGRGWPAYGALLAGADQLFVTGDSVSMLSEAVLTGRPVGIVPPRRTWAGALWMGAMDRLRPDRPIFPRDLRRFWSELRRRGLAGTLAEPRSGPLPDPAATALVRPLLERPRPPATAARDGDR